MKRPTEHYEKLMNELGRRLTPEEERILEIAESYMTVEPKDKKPPINSSQQDQDKK
jgi:hypothetical protein